jgi:molybdopterin converting factor subunit 1
MPSDHVTILYFAGLAELLGTREEPLPWPSGERTGRDLAHALTERHPELAGRLQSVRFAVNEAFVDESEVVRAGDTVALIPPVSGG